MKKGSLFLLLILSSLIFSTCKKGEEDPFLSFRSRTSRLCGDWKLEKVEGIIFVQENSGDEIQYQYVQDKEVNESFRYKKVVNMMGGFYVQFDLHTYSVSINEDGSTSANTFARGDLINYTHDTEGIWEWNNDEKTSIYFSALNVLYDDLITEISEDFWDELGFNIDASVVEELRNFEVLGLSNKELILLISYESDLQDLDINHINAGVELRFVADK